MISDHQHYVTAVNGGGMGSIFDKQAIHTNQTQLGPDELFGLNFLNDSTVTLETTDGHYVTAVGGCGGTNMAPIHTDATKIGPWETFSLTYSLTANC
jgi:hypothetical protein